MSIRKLAWLLPLFFCSCNKQDNSSNNNPQAEFIFSVKYDSVYTTYPNSNITIPFNIVVTSGDILQNPVTVSVSGLPSSILVTPSTQTVTGISGGAFTLAVGNTAPGNDTGSFTISSAAKGTQAHKLIIKVLQPIDYAPKLAGTYNTSYDFCQPDSFFNYTSVVTNVADTPYLVKISNIKNIGPGYKVRAWLSLMGGSTVTIPVQSVGPYTIWGAGTFFHDIAPYDTLYQMAIHDTLVMGIDTQYCTIHIQH